VPVIDELAGSKDRRHELGAINERLKARFKQADQVFCSVALHPARLNVHARKLLLSNVAVIALELLLRHELHTKVRDLAAAVLAVLPWLVVTLVDGRLGATPDVFTDATVDLVLRAVAT